MSLLDELKRQFDDGSVWVDRDTMHPHDDVVRKLRTEEGFKAELLRVLPALLESTSPRHLTGVVGILSEIARDVGAETLTAWAKQHETKLKEKVSWPCGVETLERGFVSAVAQVLQPGDASAIAWLQQLAWAPEWRLEVLSALARVTPEFVVTNAKALVDPAHLAVLGALKPEHQDRLIDALAPWPPERITFFTRAFWKTIPAARAPAMRARMWPRLPNWPLATTNFVERVVMPRVGIIGLPVSGRMSLLDAYRLRVAGAEWFMPSTTAGAVTVCRAHVPALAKGGLKVQLHLFALPAPGFFAAPMQPQELLAGVDAVGIVVPNDPKRWPEWRAFVANLKLTNLPHRFLATMRDRADAVPMERLRTELQLADVRECSGKDGTGVVEALDELAALALERLRTT